MRQGAAVQVFLLSIQRKAEDTFYHACHGQTQGAQKRGAERQPEELIKYSLLLFRLSSSQGARCWKDKS